MYIYIYIYYNLNLFVSIFLLSTIAPFLWQFQLLKISIFIPIEHMSTIFTLTSFLYPHSLICDFPFVWPVFHNIVLHVLGLYCTYEGKYVTFGLLNLANIHHLLMWSMLFPTYDFYYHSCHRKIICCLDMST
jgi:hypothetical protein